MPEQQEFIYVVRPARADMLITGPTEREQRIVGEHFHYLKGLCERGVVVLVGRTTDNDDTTFGICVFRAESPAAADQIAQDDPAVREGVMTVDLRPFRVALLTANR